MLKLFLDIVLKYNVLICTKLDLLNLKSETVFLCTIKIQTLKYEKIGLIPNGRNNIFPESNVHLTFLSGIKF